MIILCLYYFGFNKLFPIPISMPPTLLFTVQELKSVKDEPMDTSAAPSGDKAADNSDLKKSDAALTEGDKVKADDTKTGGLTICLLNISNNS